MNLRRYQWKGAFWLALTERGILGDQVGLGKTVQAIEAAAQANAQYILVISPKTLKTQWHKEIEKYMDDAVNVVWGPVPQLDHWPNNDKPTFVLAHYEQFQNERGPKEKGKRAKPKDVTQWYLERKWDVVIVDEVHYIKNRKSQRSKWIKKLRTNHKYGLTGTPVAEFPQDLWSLLNWLDPKNFTSFWNFVSNYCDLEENPWARHSKRIMGLKYHPDEQGIWTTDLTLMLLKKATEPYMLVRKLEDVGVELPPVQEIEVPLEMEEDQAAFYREVKRKSIIGLVKTLGPVDLWDLSGEDQLVIRSAAARYIRLQQVTSAGTIFMPGLGNTKLEWLKNYVEGGGEAGVIMTRFVHTASLVTKILQDLGVADEWIIGTYERLGTGLNLQHKRVLIAWDPPKSRLDWEQAVGRIHRLGQARNQLVYKLIVGSSVDDHAWNHIERKQSTVDMILSWLRGLQGETNE